MHVILCSGAEHLKGSFNGFRTYTSIFNYDGKRFFPNSDVFTCIREIEAFQGEKVIVIQSCNASSPEEKEKWTTADRFFELLQVLHLLNNPAKVTETGHKQFEEQELAKPSSIDVVLTCMPAGKQDHATMTGEINSAQMCLELIKPFCNSIAIIDPHPPMEFPFMQEVGVEKISLVPELVEKAKNLFNLDDPLLLTADEYGQLRMGLTGLGKKRTSSSEVEIIGNIDVRGKEIIFVDDAFFSGSTLLKTIKKYKELGATKIIPCIVHICPLVVSGEDRLKKALDELGGELVFSNTVWTKAGEGVNTAVDCSQAIIRWITGKR
ncbi:MAG: hypothetical protein ACTSP4_01420 [Candidatus Hodarchaeales archaeon]